MRKVRTREAKPGWRLWWPFVVLCVLGGSRWMLSESVPGSGTTLASASVGCGSAAVLFLLIVRPRWLAREQLSQFLRAAVGGALLITGPVIALLLPHGISGASITMALALTPVVIAVAETATHHNGGNLPGRLWPGLATIAGLLLLLAEPSLANPAEDVLLALTPVLTGCGAVLFCSARQSNWRIPAALLGACIAQGIGAAINLAMHTGGWPQMAGLATGFDAIEATLALVALERLSTTRWSAQFAIVPLLVVLESIVLMPDSMSARTVVGLLLLALAALALLIPPSEEPPFDLRASTVHPSRTD